MVIIPNQFKGPPQSGNGGYVAGCMADLFTPGPISPPVEVSLKAPPPLDIELVAKEKEGSLAIFEQSNVIATLKPYPELTLSVEPPKDVPYGKPAIAVTGCGTCFVCGEKRMPGDGLCIQARPRLDGSNIWQASFEVHPNFCDAQGVMARRYCFAALDCPGYSATSKGELAVLARFRVQVFGHLMAYEKAEVTAWPLEIKGRKRTAGTALFGSGDRLVAQAEALWVVIEKDRLRGF